MKKYIRPVACVAFMAAGILTSPLMAQNDGATGSSGGAFKKVGASGGQFLKIPVGARATGMAGAFNAISDDVTAIYWNPSGLSKLRTVNANVTYNRWIADFTHNFAAITAPIGENYTIALSALSFSTGDIPVTTLDRPEGNGSTYSVNDFALGLSFAGRITEQFSVGVNAKYVQNGFSNVASNGVVFDVGTAYETGIQGIRLGFSVHNLGSDQQFNGQDLNVNNSGTPGSSTNTNTNQALITNEFSLPLSFRAGIASEVLNDETNNLQVALDFETFSDTPEQFALGAEYTWSNLLIVRGGYRLGHDEFGLAGGLGLRYEGGSFGGQVDYSINPTSNLGLVNRISLAFTLK
ncbi:MAG TPA: PorV/PorQ family protein [Patescibacteria group bacterium]|nr:PorV/PorQ family protein [Patescibacteria group bacterium]